MLTHSNFSLVRTPLPKPSAPSKSKKKVRAKSKKNTKRNWPNCEPCNKVFPNKKTLLKHQVTFHNLKADDRPDNKPFPNSNTSTIPSKMCRPARCKACSKIVMDLPSHMKTVHPGVITSNGNKDTKVSSGVSGETPTADIRPRPGPASWKKKATVEPEVTKVTESAPTTEKLKGHSGPIVSPSNDVNHCKTDAASKVLENNSGETSRSQPTDASQTKNSSDTEVPPPPPPFGPTQSNRYQFKNLLKIGEEKK
jgi:hypothetical protein